MKSAVLVLPGCSACRLTHQARKTQLFLPFLLAVAPPAGLSPAKPAPSTPGADSGAASRSSGNCFLWKTWLWHIRCHLGTQPVGRGQSHVVTGRMGTELGQERGQACLPGAALGPQLTRQLWFWKVAGLSWHPTACNPNFLSPLPELGSWSPPGGCLHSWEFLCLGKEGEFG